MSVIINTDKTEIQIIREEIDKELDELYKLSSVLYSVENIIDYFSKRRL